MRWIEVVDKTLRWVKYSLAILMMVLGVSTALTSFPPIGGPLDFLFGSPMFVVAFGTFTFVVGILLLIGLLWDNWKVIGWSLAGTFQCFLFAAMLMAIQFGFFSALWAPNFICAVIVGALYMRWKIKYEYMDLHHKRMKGLDDHPNR